MYLEETPDQATSDRRLWLDFSGHYLEYERCFHVVLVLFGRRVGAAQLVSISPHPACVSVRPVIAVQRIVLALKYRLSLHSKGFGGNRVWLLST